MLWPDPAPDPVSSIAVVRVDVWSDYTCPWCYLGTAVAAWLESEHGCEVVWHPFELHPELLVGAAVGGLARAPWASSDAGRMMAEAGLPCGGSPPVVSSRLALEVGELARDRGVFEEWHGRTFEAYFVDGLDLSDEAVLRGVGEEAGLDPDDVSDALGSARYTGAVGRSKAEALDWGVGGIPGFLFDSRLVVPGVQSRAALSRIVTRLRVS